MEYNIYLFMSCCGGRGSYLRNLASNIKQERNKTIQIKRKRIEEELNKEKLSVDLIERVLNSSVSELVNMLNSNQITSYLLVLIFSKRIMTIGLEYEMLTEENTIQAIEIAKECDNTRRMSKLKNWTFDTKQQQTLPPLFGIPMSLKDTIDQQGYASTIGLTARHQRKQKKDGAIVSALKKNGLIIFVRSNVPQLAMTYQSHNFLWGRALNPWDKTRAVGGSSGGEGALIASRCSPIGIGSDIGGSLRIPAQFCGIYSLKPSSHRLSFKGHTQYGDSFTGQINIPPVMGPMGKSVIDLALWMKGMCDEKNYDQKDAYIKLHPFQDQIFLNPPKKMKIGYFDSIPFIPTTKSSKRAVQEAIEVLKKQGHQVVQFEIAHAKEIILIFFSIILAEGNMRGYTQMLEGEDLIEQYALLKQVTKLPNWLNKVLSSIVNWTQPRLAEIMSKSIELTAFEYLQVSAAQQKYKNQFIQSWKNNKLDMLIAPGFGSQAQLHGFSKQANLSASYTFIWNLLEMVAGAMPITVVKEDEQTYTDTFNDDITRKLQQSAAKSLGLPVGIQVVGLPYQQQKVLAVMSIIERQIPFYKLNKFPL